MRWLVGALLSVAGCNAVFDIDETTVVESAADTDGDGIYDSADNCIAIVNPGQENGDGDALGDACDRCVGVQADSDHDEDLDGRPDGCDVCPEVADFNVDDDGDGVGNPCDHDSHLTQRLRFEPFETIPAVWQGDEAWSVTAEDSAAPVDRLPAGSLGLALTDVTLAATEWSATLGVLATRHWTVGVRAGFVAQNEAGAETSCTIECGGTLPCDLSLVIDGVKIPSTPFFPAVAERLYFEVKQINPASNVYSYTCQVTVGVAYDERAPAMASWTPGIVASPTLRVTYFDLVQ